MTQDFDPNEVSTRNDKDLLADYSPQAAPILPLKSSLVFPNLVAPLMVTEQKHSKLVDDVLMKGTRIGLFLQKDLEDSNPGPDGLCRIGCSGTILKMLRFPDGAVRFLVQGLSRIKITNVVSTEPYLTAIIEDIKEPEETSVELVAYQRNLLERVKTLVNLAPYLNDEVYVSAINEESPSRLVDMVASNMNSSVQEKQSILELIDPTKRIMRILSMVNKEIEVLELSHKIQSQASEELSKSQRDYILREQIKAIRKELGHLDDRAEIEELEKKIEAAKMPDQVREVAHKELDRFSRMNPSSAEYTVSHTYLDWLVDLPWDKSTKDNLDLRRAKRILDEDHFGLHKIKDRMLEFLAVRKLNPTQKGPILCLVGPPGVGKTSLGRSIARALGRPFARISLGGMRDEAEIRGHRRTYIGAMPGRIIQAIKRAKYNNPVIMLDEIDKVGSDFRGDPSSALLETLDPEQNYSFTDHYLDLPFDLSKVMFITTANILDTIPPALRDRMEVIRISGYTEIEKVEIAKRHLLPKQITDNGLKPSQISFHDRALRLLINSYTNEAGLRNLEREVASICRKVARKVAGGLKRKTSVTTKEVEKFLGPPRITRERITDKKHVGVALGLAWTSVGGETLFVEATAMPGKKGFTITGQLGDVMQESAKAALSFVRANSESLGIDPEFMQTHDIHIHVPAGATPKDGPSAGITIATAIASLFTGRPVQPRLAMTGEITLRGEVLPIGGLKEKLLAAYRAGVKTVILPKENRKDLYDVPAEIKKGLKLIFCNNVASVLEAALVPVKKKPAKKRRNLSKKKS